MFAGWFLNDLIAAFLHQQRMPSHPEMYDENGNIIPDDILAVRFESPDDDDDD